MTVVDSPAKEQPSRDAAAARPRPIPRLVKLELFGCGLLLACSSGATVGGAGGSPGEGGATHSGGAMSVASGGANFGGSSGGSSGGMTSAQGGIAGTTGGTVAAGGVTASSGGTLAVAGAGGSAAGAATGGSIETTSGGRAVTSGGSNSGGSAPATGGAAGSSGSSMGGQTGSASPTVWIAGDSTVANGSTPCPVGWGAQFKSFFKDSVKVVNSAVGGRSVRTWLYNVTTEMDSSGECVLQTDGSGKPTLQARWQDMLNGMKTGDYLFIQFGINDGSATCDRHVGINAFKESYGMMAAAAKQRGAQPVFLTPASAIACNGSTARATRGEYVTATVDAGKQYEVPVIDLHALTIALYNARGFCPIPGGDVSATTTGPVGDFFCDDHTHFSQAGSVPVAELVAGAVRDQKLGLAQYLK